MRRSCGSTASSTWSSPTPSCTGSPTRDSVLRGVERSLRPGGRLLFQMGGRGMASNVVQVMMSLLSRDEWGRYFHDFSLPYRFCAPEEYTQWLEEAGLHPLRVELVPKDMTHEGVGGLAAWIRTTWLPFTQRLPEELRDDFIARDSRGLYRALSRRMRKDWSMSMRCGWRWRRRKPEAPGFRRFSGRLCFTFYRELRPLKI